MSVFTVRRALLAVAVAMLCVLYAGVSVASAHDIVTADELDAAQAFPPIPLPRATYWLDNGFAALSSKAPDLVGIPLSPERPGDEEGSTVQVTTTGLLYWRGLGHPVVHFDGNKRVALTDDRGLVDWLGGDLDPPPAPQPVIFGAVARARCIIDKESHGLDVPNSQGSGAWGPGQYFPGTWAYHTGLYRNATGYTGSLSLHSYADVERVMSYVLTIPGERNHWTVGGC